MTERVLITGVGVEIPGVASAAGLLEPGDRRIDPPEFEPQLKLGRKGLLFKDRATRLALCAAQSALADAGLPTAAADQRDPERLGVVASSNLGNAQTICKVVDAIRAGTVRAASPLDLPNASSNIIPACVAIRFGCQALNLMLCGGATSGTDAVHLARNAILAGRARRMIVVGVEPREPSSTRLMAQSLAAWLPGEAPGEVWMGDGAAALVLESESAARERGAGAAAAIGPYAFAQELERSVEVALGGGPRPELWWTPPRRYAPVAAAIDRAAERFWERQPPRAIDVEPALGDGYGMLGVLQCAAASAALRSGSARAALATSGGCWRDGAASVALEGLGR